MAAANLLRDEIRGSHAPVSQVDNTCLESPDLKDICSSVIDSLSLSSRTFCGLNSSTQSPPFVVGNITIVISLVKYIFLDYFLNMEKVRFPKIAEAIKTLLEQNDGNRSEVGRILKTNTTNIFQWATGEREPSIENLVKIAKAVNKTPGYLMNDPYCIMIDSLPESIREYHKQRVKEDYERYCADKGGKNE